MSHLSPFHMVSSVTSLLLPSQTVLPSELTGLGCQCFTQGFPLLAYFSSPPQPTVNFTFQDLDSVILIDPFKLRMFFGSVIFCMQSSSCLTCRAPQSCHHTNTLTDLGVYISLALWVVKRFAYDFISPKHSCWLLVLAARRLSAAL